MAKTDGPPSHGIPPVSVTEWFFASEHERFFPRTNPDTGVTEWFFAAREGTIGPYESRERAVQALLEFKTRWQGGGRSNPAHPDRSPGTQA